MIYRATEGTVVAANQDLLDDNEEPFRLKQGYPKVALLDKDNMVISSAIATPGTIPGNWLASIAVPDMGLTAATEFVIRWRSISISGEKSTIKDIIIIEPQVDDRESDIVALFGDPKVTFVLPTVLNPGDTAVYQIYANNTPVLLEPADLLSTGVGVSVTSSGIDQTRVTIPLVVPSATLFSNLLKVDVTRTGVAQPQSYLFKLWALTPQLMLTMTQLEDYLNKSRIANVIPELRYTTGDLVTYLERGLNMFNMIEKPTSFTGMNMQGVLLDAHLICSSYYALSAQLLAEGSLAFDFSGQGVSLNVDRTPQLDAALGKMESLMDSRIIPLKKELVKNGFTSGDGSIGSGNMNNPYAKGLLSVMNAATTRISTPGNRFMGRKR